MYGAGSRGSTGQVKRIQVTGGKPLDSHCVNQLTFPILTPMKPNQSVTRERLYPLVFYATPGGYKQAAVLSR